MKFYLIAVLVSVISLLIFYLKTRKKQFYYVSNKEYAMSDFERDGYIASAERSKKNNSPISDEPFNKLYLEGSNIVNEEKFKIDIIPNYQGSVL